MLHGAAILPPRAQMIAITVEWLSHSISGKDIAPEKAMSCVYGYKGLDMTIRDLQAVAMIKAALVHL